MAQRLVQIRICNRCAFGKDVPATTKRKFAIGDDHYLIDLCEKHATMFDREVGAWALYGEDDPAFQPVRATFTDDVLERGRRAAEIRARHDQEQHVHRVAHAEDERPTPIARNSVVADTLRWSLSSHAHERCVERGVTPDEAIDCAANPDHVKDSPEGVYCEGAKVHHKGDVRIAVDPERRIVITVYPRLNSAHDERRTTYVNPVAASR